MKGKRKSDIAQLDLLRKTLMEQLNPDDPLLKLAKVFPWDDIETEFGQFYAERGRPAKPIRLMVGLLILKQLENLSDERLVLEWVHNPYFQKFCGEHYFQWKFPCDPSDIAHFRRRIGEAGCTKIFQASVAIHGDHAREDDVVIDTTVQEKNITFPTDVKLYVKIIAKCRKFARKENIALRQSYVREECKLLRTIRFSHGEKKKSAAVKRARKRLKTIAGRLTRDFSRKMCQKDIDKYKEVYENDIGIFTTVLKQKKNSKKKIYSLHEPQVSCITKNKAGKKHEFGSKASVCMTKTTCIILGVASFQNNPYDGDTLQKTIDVVESITGRSPVRAFCDRGYRGRTLINNTEIIIPNSENSSQSQSAKREARKNFGRRSAIEPVIGHLRHDFRLCRNYLKGALGDSINLLMAATAFNLKKWLREQPLCLFLGLRGIFGRLLLFFEQNIMFFQAQLANF